MNDEKSAHPDVKSAHHDEESAHHDTKSAHPDDKLQKDLEEIRKKRRQIQKDPELPESPELRSMYGLMKNLEKINKKKNCEKYENIQR